MFEEDLKKDFWLSQGGEILAKVLLSGGELLTLTADILRVLQDRAHGLLD